MISVIVPIYKVEEYLPRCVESLLGQTDGDFELILVDDGSPDRCSAICDEYAAKDPRIAVIHKENGGLSDARNAGLEIARQGLETTGSDICECGILRTEGDSCPEPAETAPEVFDTVAALEQLIRDGRFHQYVWNKLYRREVIGDFRFPVGKTNEDEFWTYQGFGRAKRVAGIDAVLYNYFQRPGSIMGAGYSLKRLDGLEAKARRQAYMERRFPQLAGQAKINLHVACMYSGQMALKYMTGDDRKRAMEIIDGYLQMHPVEKTEILQTSGGTKLWLTLAGKNFWATCRLKNLLRRGF